MDFYGILGWVWKIVNIDYIKYVIIMFLELCMCFKYDLNSIDKYIDEI